MERSTIRLVLFAFTAVLVLVLLGHHSHRGQPWSDDIVERVPFDHTVVPSDCAHKEEDKRLSQLVLPPRGRTPREQLEWDTRQAFPHRAFGAYYVVNLPHRQDRRAHMLAMEPYLDNVHFTFVDGVVANGSEVTWVLERLWEEDEGIARMDERRWGAGNNKWTWQEYYVAHLDNPSAHPLVNLPEGTVSEDELLGVRAALGGSLRGVTACFASHLHVLSLIRRTNAGTSALVLEDDVDFSWNFSSTWSEIAGRLPETWKQIYLGYSISNELPIPPPDGEGEGERDRERLYHPMLRPSIKPMGTYGYALSPTYLPTLLTHLTAPKQLFRDSIDTLMASFHTTLPPHSVFSLVPKLVGHLGGGEMGTDVGEGSGWHDDIGEGIRVRLRQRERMGREMVEES